jgi:membrane protease YdiL (CAAX protease family)
MPRTFWTPRPDLLAEFGLWDFVKFLVGSIALWTAVIAVWFWLLTLDALSNPANDTWIEQLLIVSQHAAMAVGLYLFAVRKVSVGWAGIGFRATNPTPIGQSVLLAVITAAFATLAVKVLQVEIAPLFEADPTEARTAILITCSGIVVAPLVEEAVFRGILFGFVRRRFNFAIAAILSSVFFGLIHGFGVYTVYATFLGFVMAAIYERANSLWAPVAFHMTYNALFLVGFFMTAVS